MTGSHAQLPAPNHPCVACHSSDEARAAWERRYPGIQSFTLERKDDEPFASGRCLGRGGYAKVYESNIDGVPIALKQVDMRRKGCAEPWFESDILRKVSKNRHRHVVELIGSYLHHQRGKDVLGLLLWPLAQFDLEHILEEIDALLALKTQCLPEEGSDIIYALTQDELYTLEDLSILTSTPWEQDVGVTSTQIHTLYDRSIECLHTLFGCLAEAILYIHNDLAIRHRDLKPSQVLLSGNGLWLTDFGRAEDFSQRDTSETNGGEGMTPKYHAPERVAMADCGRAEDIFALGCTYLEMAYRLYGLNAGHHLNPKNLPRFKYSEQLEQLETWLAPFTDGHNAQRDGLGKLLRSMLAHDPQERPSIEDVIRILKTARSEQYQFFRSCCLHDKDPPDSEQETAPTLDYRAPFEPSSRFATVTDGTYESEEPKEQLELSTDSREHFLQVFKSRDIASFSSPIRPYGDSPISRETSPKAFEDASRAFVTKFGSAHMNLERYDPLPLRLGRRLGSSRDSDVYEVEIDNTRMACKRTYRKRLEREEIKLLRHVSHQHIVRYVGSYVQKQGKLQELGLITWPVADCDLGSYFDQVNDLSAQFTNSKDAVATTDLRAQFDLLWKINASQLSDVPSDSESASILYQTATRTMQQYVGCLSSSLAHLHKHKIYHQDLKPSNVLLTSNGPYLTAFGLRKETHDTSEGTASELSTDATYDPPEWEFHKVERESADIFALGRIFLDILSILSDRQQILQYTDEEAHAIYSIPRSNDLERIDGCLERLALAPAPRNTPALALPGINTARDTSLLEVGNAQAVIQTHHQLSTLARLIRPMIAYNPDHRPSISTIVETLSRQQQSLQRDMLHGYTGDFFGPCCWAATVEHDDRLQLDFRSIEDTSSGQARIKGIWHSVRNLGTTEWDWAKVLILLLSFSYSLLVNSRYGFLTIISLTLVSLNWVFWNTGKDDQSALSGLLRPVLRPRRYSSGVSFMSHPDLPDLPDIKRRTQSTPNLRTVFGVRERSTLFAPGTLRSSFSATRQTSRTKPCVIRLRGLTGAIVLGKRWARSRQVGLESDRNLVAGLRQNIGLRDLSRFESRQSTHKCRHSDKAAPSPPGAFPGDYE